MRRAIQAAPGAALSGLALQGLALPGVALLTVDLQRSREPGLFPSAQREALGHYLDLFRAAGRPIFHAVGGAILPLAESAAQVLDVRFLPEPGMALYGHYLARGYLQRIGPGEVMLQKRGWGAFHGTALESSLRALQVETLLIAGCDFPAGPRATLYEASERFFRTVLLEDAVSGVHALARTETENMGVALRSRPRLASEPSKPSLAA